MSEMSSPNPSPVTVITGGTKGIGLALAREFAAAGHDLLLVARTETDLKAVSQELCDAFSITVHAVIADLSSPDGCRTVADAIAQNGLYAHYLVNNAGYGLAGPFAEIDGEHTLNLLDLNVRALTDLTRRLLPGMIERGAGGVLNVASLGGLSPGPYSAIYYASKAYVVSLSESLAQELRGTGVRSAVLAPGPVATEFHARQGTDTAYYIKFLGILRPEEVARFAFKAFRRGQTLIIPGWTNMVNAVFMRLIPHFILVPFTAWLLKPRAGAKNAETDGPQLHESSDRAG